MKTVCSLLMLVFCINVNAQAVFEKRILHPNSSENGDMILNDLLIAQKMDSTEFLSTGHYLYSQDLDTAHYRVVLVNNDTLANQDFAYDYKVMDLGYRAYNAFSYSLVQDSNILIMAGKLEDNSQFGSTAANGGDVLLIKTDIDGNTIAQKRIDCGGNDVAWSVKSNGLNNNAYLVCGTGDSGHTDHPIPEYIDQSFSFA